MSNILSSSNTLILIGVGILAALVIFLAVWLARTSSRVAKERAKAEAMEQRLAHVEEYLARASKRDGALRAPQAEAAEPAVKPMKPVAAPAAKAKPVGGVRQPEAAEARQSRRSKRQPVIPYGQAKESLEDVYSGARPAGSAASASAQRPQPRPAELERQSVTRDARRRRELRRQEEMRRQAQSIVQEMQQADTIRTRPSVSGAGRRS